MVKRLPEATSLLLIVGGFLVLCRHTPSPRARQHTTADDANHEGPVLVSQLTSHCALDGKALGVAAELLEIMALMLASPLSERVGVRKLEQLRMGSERRSGTGARTEHRRSGDPGLWVRNKEQWADRGSEPPTPSCLCERTPCQDPNLRGSKGWSGWKRPVS